MLHIMTPYFQPTGESIRVIIWIVLHDDSISMRFPRHGGVVNHPKPGDRDMKMKLNGGTVARTALAGIVGALTYGAAVQAHAAADLTINSGSTSAPYTAVGLFQVVEPGNPFNDTPRTAVSDLGGSLSVAGSTAPLTSSTFSIDDTFTTTGWSSFTAQLESLVLGNPLTLSFYKGGTLLASNTGAAGVPFDLSASPILIGPGKYDVLISGPIGSSQESDGQFTFNGAAASAPVSGVPEPAIWAMMLVGFGGMGAMLRGSRRRPSIVAA